MSYTIGQVVFVVLSKKSQVYPMQVVEVITKKTLKGEEVNYVLQGGSDKASTVMLDQVDGEVFDTAEAARSTLVSRASAHINKIVDLAVTKAREWYGASGRADAPPTSLEPLDPEDMETDKIVLPDGTVARIKMPSIV